MNNKNENLIPKSGESIASNTESDSENFGLKKGDRLALVDGYNYVFRAYHALPALTRSSDNAPTGAVTGFCNMLFKLLSAQESKGLIPIPTHIAVIFDSPKESFRKQLYSDYKAHRPPAPEDLIPQFSFVREATKAFFVPAFEVEGYEADDIIATLTNIATQNGAQVDIYSGDKDLMQLINDDVCLVDAMKNKIIRPKQVKEKFGVLPEQLGDLLALMGDSADNIPGVAGIGVKTAASLLQEFGDLEQLLQNAHTIKQNKRRETLIEQAEIARLSRTLVTLDGNVPLTPENLTRKNLDAGVVLPFLASMDMNVLSKRVINVIGDSGFESAIIDHGASETSITNSMQNAEQGSLLSAMAPSFDIEFIEITNIADIELIREDSIGSGTIALSAITDEADPMSCNVLGLGFSASPKRAFYLNVTQLQSQKESAQDEAGLVKAIEKLLLNSGIRLLGYNSKDMAVPLINNGINLQPEIEDIKIVAQTSDVVDQEITPTILAKEILGISADSLDPLINQNVRALKNSAAAIEFSPCAQAANIIFQLWNKLSPTLIKNRIARQYEQLDKPMIPILARMQLDGVKINQDKLRELSVQFSSRMHELSTEIWQLADQEFNIASPSQIADILFGKLGLPGGRKTSGGKWSTDAKVLDDLGHSGHRIAIAIHEWRQLAKLKNTYTDVLPKFVNKVTNRVHTSYGLGTVSTGRLSSNNPNLQNIPIRTADGRRIREAFIAREGYKILSADYSQIELRLLAHIANEAALIEAFKAGEDIHAATARALLGDPGADASLRRKAKAINFGIIYGISAHGLSKQIGSSRSEAADFISDYMKRFPGIEGYMKRMPHIASLEGYVSTIFGRKITTSGINDTNHMKRSFSQRFAINAPIQGSAADLLRRAMIRMPDVLKGADLSAIMMLQVHDELVFEVPEDQVSTSASLIKTVMEKAGLPLIQFKVPIVVDIGIADNWNEAH